MTAGRQIRSAEILLEEISEEPEVVLYALQAEERVMMLSALRLIEEQSSSIAGMEDLVAMSNAVYNTVTGFPELRQILLPSHERDDSLQRQITTAQHLAARADDQYVQERIAQIRNHVLECRESLEKALRAIGDDLERSDTKAQVPLNARSNDRLK